MEDSPADPRATKVCFSMRYLRGQQNSGFTSAPGEAAARVDNDALAQLIGRDRLNLLTDDGQRFGVGFSGATSPPPDLACVVVASGLSDVSTKLRR